MVAINASVSTGGYITREGCSQARATRSPVKRLLTAIEVASAARRRSIGLRMLLAMRAIAESPRWSRSGSQM